jgi:tight adherence protein C
LNSTTFGLSLIVMAPILFWGIWIISEESFDELNSRNRWSQMESSLQLTRFGLSIREKTMASNSSSGYTSDDGANRELNVVQSGARVLRSRILPIYFGLITALIVLIALMVTQGSRFLLQGLSLAGVLGSFIILVSRKDKKTVNKINRDIEAEIPAQIQLLTILVSSGISPAKALELLSERSSSVSALAFKGVVDEIKNGSSIVESLDELKKQFSSNSLRRFVTSLVLGIERGSALSPILIAQVRDSRLAQKTEVMRRAGKAEIGLMIPVVFLILPISILFALWPSYTQLGSFL